VICYDRGARPVPPNHSARGGSQVPTARHARVHLPHPPIRTVFGLAALAIAASGPAWPQGAPKADPRAEIARKIPGTKPEDLRAIPVPGLYELARGGDIAYVSADGRYAISGDLYDLERNDNLTEARRRGIRSGLVAGFPSAQMLVFEPKAPKHTITVFTDIDCGYCRKLHSQVAEYNRLGIGVHYLLFPRSGPGTESWAKAERVWCSKDRNDALTRAKRGENISEAKCGTTPVARHYELGEEVGVNGTPAIVLESGELLPGYVPPAMLAEHLKTAAAR
jgi:thiol:disulfide interchange protein DsbC